MTIRSFRSTTILKAIGQSSEGSGMIQNEFGPAYIWVMGICEEMMGITNISSILRLSFEG